MSDDTTKLLPTHDAGDERTTVLPTSGEAPSPVTDVTRVMPVGAADAADTDATTVLPASGAASHESETTTVLPATSEDTRADDGTEVLPAVTPSVPADTEVMTSPIAVKSRTEEDAQATQALEQIPSALDDFAETDGDDADAADDAETDEIADTSGGDVASSEPPASSEPAPAPALDRPLTDLFAGDAASAPRPDPIPPLGETPEPTPFPVPDPSRASGPAPDPHATPFPRPADRMPASDVPPSRPWTEAPQGPSVPTILFGLVGVLVGVCGLFVGLEIGLIGDWLVALSPQTVIAALCAAVGAILLIVALVWGVAKAVAKPKTGSEAGVE